MRFYFPWDANPKFLKASFFCCQASILSVWLVFNMKLLWSVYKSLHLCLCDRPHHEFCINLVWLYDLPSPSQFLLWPLNTTFKLSLAALAAANYSVTKTKVPVLKYGGEVDPDMEIIHLSLFYLLLILPYSV